LIKPSSVGEIRQLIEALGGSDHVRREAAIARLAVIGPRAVDALLQAYASTSDRDLRIAVLRALESSGDRRTIALAREALPNGGDVAVAASTALHGLLDSPHGPTATEALDQLVATVLDRSVERLVRIAALDALHAMPDSVRARIREALTSDPDPHLRARALDSSDNTVVGDAIWQDAIEGKLPATPAVLRDLVQTRGASSALATLQKMIDTVRTKEGTVPAVRRAEWQTVRGALHQSLALRGSRIAVYDLRESLEDAKGTLPASFLAALHVVGDLSCLEPLAAAYAQKGADPRWRTQLAAAFRAIATRERITRRHPVIKRIAERWPDAARELTGRA
jgi:HEAT repeat protein